MPPDFFLNTINLRHLEISYYQFSVLADWFGQLINLRHLSMSNSAKLIELPDGIGQLINLRYMDVSHCGKLTHLPDGIGRLINLRHLDISHCIGLTTLPDGIGTIDQSKTPGLDMYSCQSLTQLPKDIGQLINLRCFNIMRCDKLAELPVGLEQMHFLQTLPWFVVGGQASIQTLQGINQLSGKLQIRGLEQVQDAREAKEANLAAKKNLSSLSLIWQQNNSNNSDCEAAEGCNKCEQLPPLGKLRLRVLKVLTIKGMDSLKCIGNEFYSEGGKREIKGFFFRSLERLVFENMPNLEPWDQYHDNLLMKEERRQTFTFPCLKELALSGCPKLGLLPFLILPCLQQLHVLNCEKVVVRSLPSLTFLKLAGQLSFPEVEGVSSYQNPDALETLEIEKSGEVCYIPEDIVNLTALRSLKIASCHKLISLPREGLTKLSSLKSLKKFNCNALNSLPTMGIIREGMTRSYLVTLILRMVMV
ncbi:Disease resistance protein rga2 [Thalictrum thalictroides]|uniref:Disease resistance protein rga2 n=1 Tax=Thalictrum thalictroides TaxID=46969 RepID=A0A7J6VHZ9_THATH|nr:Disease resistance protein rga2 [Thalictrum thalictroides]